MVALGDIPLRRADMLVGFMIKEDAGIVSGRKSTQAGGLPMLMPSILALLLIF